jgi:SSS family solute:Na+ symporter
VASGKLRLAASGRSRGGPALTTTVILVYLGLVILIGGLSHRLFRGTGEDYFVASRTIGPFLLLMSLFGTNMTAFAILGASAQAYHVGIGVFALMASSSALVIPAVFFFVGTRLWGVGKRFGFLTQVEYFRQRWGSDRLGLLLFVVLVALVIPYLLIGVMGGGITLHQITGGQVPQWSGGLLVSAVVLVYVCAGGLRGTAWANAFQTLVFMVLGAVAFYVIVERMGGLEHALSKVAGRHPELLIRGARVSPIEMVSYTFVPLSVGMFPHMFMHCLTAKSARTFRWPLICYPLCIALVWIPSVLLGMLGTVDFPGLQGPAANSILIRMIDLYAPGILAGLLAAGVFAAIMSSLDSQVLALGTMFTQDIVRHYRFHDNMSERQQVRSGRLFVFLILALTYVLSLVVDRSIFKMAIWSFTGFAALFPVVVAALFWKRSTTFGVMASVVSVVVMWSYFFLASRQIPHYTVGGTGLMPVAVMFLVSSAILAIGSLLTRPPEQARIARFFGPERR